MLGQAASTKKIVREEVTEMLHPLRTIEYENEILELIDTQDELTRSDLQGIVTVLVNMIMQRGYEIIRESKKKSNKVAFILVLLSARCFLSLLPLFSSSL